MQSRSSESDAPRSPVDPASDGKRRFTREIDCGFVDRAPEAEPSDSSASGRPLAATERTAEISREVAAG